MSGTDLAEIRPDELLTLSRTRSLAARATLTATRSDMYFDTAVERSERELIADVLRNLIRDVNICIREKAGRGDVPAVRRLSPRNRRTRQPQCARQRRNHRRL